MDGRISDEEFRLILDELNKCFPMAFYHSVKSFYSVNGTVNYAEENESPSDENFIDIVEIPPPVNELTDEEDLDD
ncbi:Hypothetical predicted protein [Octopus vulgaris]|uniref:Uncharacterized protein n=1 Tax=Octopus vulgaris TaxID=6645 RepID=A0AA36F8Q6_OCTVU|nr:Hypothetical predicted protein [Octopus vulgaris]